MRSIKKLAIAIVLALFVSTSAWAGDISGGRTANAAGDISGGKAVAGDISGGKAPGDISGGKLRSSKAGDISGGIIGILLTLLSISR